MRQTGSWDTNLGWLTKRSKGRSAAEDASADVELIQFALPDRSADVDDVIVNVTGALFGYLLLITLRTFREAG